MTNRRRGLARAGSVFVVALLCVGIALAEKTCPSCGTENSDSAKFCKKCGAKLGPAPVRPATPRLDGSASVAQGSVTITSDPDGADVSVDGRARGKTPLRLDDLGPGRHQYTLSREGFREFYGAFSITGQYGAVVVTSDPVGAEVLLDGVLQGQTTETGLPLPRLLYGSHKILVRLTGYRDIEKTVDVKSAGPLAVNFRLGWGKGFLRVQSEPSGAKVMSDTRLLGNTPLLNEVDPARYMLTVSRPGFYDWVGYAQVQFAETSFVLATLDKVRGRKLPFLLLGLVGAAGTAYSAYKGEAEYAKYRDATSPAETERLQKSTQKWDLYRNAGAALSAGLLAVYFTVRW